MSELVRVDVGQAELTCLVDGPADGPLVLCLHGFPDCARSFRAQVEPLVARGHRVVRPWMRGYAPSSLARDRRYDAESLAADLCALAKHFSSAKVRLVGHDWSALAGYAAVALAPHLFSHLATVAVPPMRFAGRFATPAQLKRSWYIAFFQVPGMAERKVAADGMAFIDKLWRDWSPGWQAPAAELAEVKAALSPYPHLEAALGYYRALGSLNAWFGASRALVTSPIAVPGLYVHGVDDGCIGVELTAGIESAYRAGVQVHRVPGAGHFVHQEKPAEFNELLLKFLE